MINIFLFLSILFLFTFLVGTLLEKIRIPWIFAALLLGAILAVHNYFSYLTATPTFDFLANLGMYFLLFIIGFEIDLANVKKIGGFIAKVSFVTILLSAILGGITIKIVFHYSWFISMLVGFSFATVGEAILIPILEEFKIVNTKLGQTIIGVGTLDDIVEVFTLIIVILMLGSKIHGGANIALIMTSLLILFILTYGLTKLKSHSIRFKVSSIESLFLFTVNILFIFLGVGEYAAASALGAILAGIGLKTFIPGEKLKLIESEIKAVCYGLFAPIFFLWVGVSMDIKYLTSYFLLVFLITIVSSGAKYLGSFIAAKRELGARQAVLLGTGLSVRFSTSIVIVKILFENGVIDNDLYSVIIASSIILTFAIPILFSQMLRNFNPDTAF